MKKIKLGLVVGCFFFSVFSAIAAELKFVVVDIQTVVNESKAGKESIAQLKKKFQNDETNLKNQENRIQNLRRELQQSSLLKKSAKEKKQEELIKIQQIFNREREVFFQKVNVEEKKLVLSGILPTGSLHLGNYFGAIIQFLELQKAGANCYYFVADLHALTSIQKKDSLQKNTLEIVKSYIACGIDPEKALIYKQSDILEIPYLTTILSAITPEGLLRRCTTFKDKAAKEEIVSLGLLSYPVLMAADILIVGSSLVPVGEDQLQHLEITRDIAQKFNHLFGEVFTIPKAQVMKSIRVPSLDGSGKMGKSDNNTVSLLDSPETILKKVMSAKTDLGPEKGKEMSETMKNFYAIMKLCSNEETYQEYLSKYNRGEQKFYAAMKKQLAEDIIQLTAPIKEKYHSDACADDKIIQLLADNAQKVRSGSKNLLAKVQEKVGIFSF